MHRMKFTLRAILVCLLLVLQHGALLHGLSHITDDKYGERENDSPLLHYQACALCAAYAPADSGALPATFTGAPSLRHELVALSSAPRLLPAATAAYLTRAPPAAV